MYRIQKTMEISGSHKLTLPYDSPCSRLHGHNWKVTVEIESEHLNQDGMIVDFCQISKVVNRLDHQYANHIVKTNPTAENIAQWIAMRVDAECLLPTNARITQVAVQESEGNVACYIP